MIRLLFLLLLLACSAPAATCKGEDPCKACHNCTQCKYCNSGQGSCSIKREQQDRKSEARRKARVDK